MSYGSNRQRAKLGGGRGAHRLTRQRRPRADRDELFTRIHTILEAGLKVADRWAIAISVAVVGYLTKQTLISTVGVMLGFVAFIQAVLMPRGIMWFLRARFAAKSRRRQFWLQVGVIYLLTAIGSLVFSLALELTPMKPG